MNAFLTSGVLAASMLLGQTSEPKTGTGPYITPAQATTQPTQTPSRPILNWFNREDRPIISKIQSWFKREPQDNKQPGPFIPARGGVIRETPPPLSNPAPPSTDFPRKLPNPSSQLKTSSQTVAPETPAGKTKVVQQADLQQIALPKNAKSPIRAQFANRIGRDENFEWVTGQLEIENGNFVVYYATPETIDKYHGRVIVFPQQVDMKQFRKGDLVSVRGQLTQRPTAQGVVPIYRLTTGSLIERAKDL